MTALRTALFALMLALLAGPLQAATWYLDKSETEIAVIVGYLGSQVTVNFNTFDGRIEFDDRRPQDAKAVITVSSADVETGLGIVNQMVRSPDYLNAAAYPTITFRLDRLVQTSKSTADIFGTITLLGVSKPVLFKAEVFRYGPSKSDPTLREAGFNLTSQIDRREFGNDTGIPAVSAVLPVRIRLLMRSRP